MYRSSHESPMFHASTSNEMTGILVHNARLRAFASWSETLGPTRVKMSPGPRTENNLCIVF